MVPNALFKMPSPTFSENAGGQVPRVHSTYSEEKAAKALREYNAWMKSYGYAMNRLKTYNEPVLTGGAVREHDERAGHQTRAATTVLYAPQLGGRHESIIDDLWDHTLRTNLPLRVLRSGCARGVRPARRVFRRHPRRGLQDANQSVKRSLTDIFNIYTLASIK